MITTVLCPRYKICGYAGRCRGVQWSSGLLAMLVADSSDPQSPRTGVAAEGRPMDELPPAHNTFEYLDDQKQVNASEGMHSELQFNENAIEGAFPKHC